MYCAMIEVCNSDSILQVSAQAVGFRCCSERVRRGQRTDAGMVGHSKAAGALGELHLALAAAGGRAGQSKL